jgi:hypothetical protein
VAKRPTPTVLDIECSGGFESELVG